MAEFKEKRTLNISNYFDCMTVKELKEISELDCSKSMDVNKSVIFS